MIRIIYIIDTSSLIALNRHNPRDVYPGVWQEMGTLIDSKRLFAPREVFEESSRLDDSLAEWTKTQMKMFIEPTLKQIEIVKEILRKYPSIIKLDKRYAADPWVIALAIEMIKSPQKALVEVKRIVVTEEKLRGERIRIPFICQEYMVDAIDIIEMFRMEGWKF